MRMLKFQFPIQNKDEVLLKLEAASLNPFDWKVQKGMLWPLLPRRFPHIPGTDVAGEVVQVGPGVKKFKAGDKVVAWLTLLPPEVSAATAVGLPVAGLTAHQALIQSAGSSLMEVLGNTHVTATCGARNLDLVKSLGADEVIDYKTPEGATLKSPSGRKYDAVIHCATGIPWSTFEPDLSANGKVIDITPGLSAVANFALGKLTFSKKQLVPLLLSPKAQNLDYLLKLVREGKLKTIIDSKYPLTKAEDAWAKSIDGHATGKIIVEP
ncbi:Oxidoreductase, zinc-binding dehydrogenase family protein [Prunus dulcis]|uniref:Oxidoreductase, zinc-binding dehydrogenase family protein n=1 Tax=Prunus dulcis TaxID=3755 RepID=A0A4Y1S1Z3_PRUDU|nr:Oxidoreductase, zinc-binding dehydrogenase family protein [Prunus dulcis]